MNHRQWKKKFKKEHGRNPYPQEDKQFFVNIEPDKWNEFCEEVAKITKELCVVMKQVIDEFAKSCIELNRVISKNVIELIGGDNEKNNSMD